MGQGDFNSLQYVVQPQFRQGGMQQQQGGYDGVRRAALRFGSAPGPPPLIVQTVPSPRHPPLHCTVRPSAVGSESCLSARVVCAGACGVQ